MPNLRATLATVTPDMKCCLCGRLPSEGAVNEKVGVVCLAMLHDRHTVSEFRDDYIKRLPKINKVRITGVPGAALLDATRRIKSIRSNSAHPACNRKNIRLISLNEIRELPDQEAIMALSYVHLHRLLNKLSEALAQVRRQGEEKTAKKYVRRMETTLLFATVEWQLRKVAAHSVRMEGKKKRRRGPLEAVMRQRAKWYRLPGPVPFDLIPRTDTTNAFVTKK